MNIIIEIVIWIALLLIIGILIGEIRHRYLEKNTKSKYTNDFVPLRILSARGSWRLAQGRMMDKRTFAILRNAEYSKKL